MVCCKTQIHTILRCHVNGWICFRVRLLQAFLWHHQVDIVCSRLGDRHGENILFEEGTGGILHVDFNCLFDKVIPIIAASSVSCADWRRV